jgi:ribonuclease HII
MSLKELQELLLERGPEVYPEVIAALEQDPRGGARRLLRQCQERMGAWELERQQLQRLYSYERQVWAMGYRQVAGVDQVGRGPLAGPVVAAAVILPQDVHLPGVTDVKRLTPRRRKELYDQIRKVAVDIGIGMVQPDGIDEASVLIAIHKAMARAVNSLKVTPDYLLVDSYHLPGVSQPQAPIVGGESLSISVAAAAVVAKVVRDEHMEEMDRLYPQYGFAQHKGYATPEHRAMLEEHGPSPIHRRMTGPANMDRRLLPENLILED